MHLDVVLDYVVFKKGMLPNPIFFWSTFHMPTLETPNVKDTKSHKNKG
jgi:hypothetical protein